MCAAERIRDLDCSQQGNRTISTWTSGKAKAACTFACCRWRIAHHGGGEGGPESGGQGVRGSEYRPAGALQGRSHALVLTTLCTEHGVRRLPPIAAPVFGTRRVWRVHLSCWTGISICSFTRRSEQFEDPPDAKVTQSLSHRDLRPRVLISRLCPSEARRPEGPRARAPARSLGAPRPLAASRCFGGCALARGSRPQCSRKRHRQDTRGPGLPSGGLGSSVHTGRGPRLHRASEKPRSRKRALGTRRPPGRGPSPRRTSVQPGRPPRSVLPLFSSNSAFYVHRLPPRLRGKQFLFQRAAQL